MTKEVTFSAEDFAKALEGQTYNYEKGQVITGKVCEYDTKGVYIDIGGKCPGFLPLKEIVPFPGDDLSVAFPIGYEREFAVLKEPNKNEQVTLSIRQLELDRIWEKMVERQTSGESMPVQVTGVNRGGVVVEADSLRGFIPRSHLIQQQGDLDALIGQYLTVTILEVDSDRQKLVMSHRLAERATRMRDIATGALVTGTIVSLKPYGAFVDLGGVTGLLHARQISGKRVNELEDLLSVGQEIKVIISEIDEWQQRIALAIKPLESYPGEVLEKFDTVMENAEERWAAQQESANTNSPNNLPTNTPANTRETSNDESAN